jgi:DNA-directed RNA polymerase subunit M/transcription elongation factor TFIIS
MDCPLCQGLLFSNIDKEEKIFIYCTSCEYKSYPGISVYKKMEERIKNAGQ